MNFEDARGLSNPEMNFSNVSMRQWVTPSNTGAIPKIINHSAGRGRGFIRINSETIQNRYKVTSGIWRTAPNNPNQSLFWDEIVLPVPDLSKSTIPQLDKEVTGNEYFQIDSFLKENNQFLIETNELIKHYDEQVIR